MLTDGKDSRFDKSQALNPGDKLTIPEFLAERFGALGIRITVVFFRSSGLGQEAKKEEEAEVQAARDNFKPLQGLEPPGQFIEARNLDQLIESLKAGLEQKLVCRILDAAQDPAWASST